MTVVLLALGSRGDVQPMAALAAELQRQGYACVLVATSDFRALAEQFGVSLTPIPVDSRSALALTRARFGAHLFGNPWGQAWLLRHWLADIADAVTATALSAVTPGDTVLSGILTRDLATSLADGIGVRSATILHTGQLPTAHPASHFANAYYRGHPSYDRWGSRLSWQVATSLGMPISALARSRLGLPPRGARAATLEGDRHPCLIAASPLVVPPAPDWPPQAHQCGYLGSRLDFPGTPDGLGSGDPGLAAFLDDGDGPVYVGFGSLGGSGAYSDLGVVLDAARLCGRRVITPSVGATPAGAASEQVFVIESADHDWLLPRMAGIVHHGGAGTTWAGLRSGRPSVAVPFGVDQPYHGQRLHALGVGPKPLAVQQLSPLNLARLIDRLTDGSYVERAAHLATLARAEDGTGAAVATLRRLGSLDENPAYPLVT